MAKVALKVLTLTKFLRYAVQRPNNEMCVEEDGLNEHDWLHFQRADSYT